MTKSTIWISYDLGVRGDYEGLYAWLDAHGAQECGNSVALLTYEYTGAIKKRLKADLKNAFTVDKRTKIYVIFRDRSTNKNKGSFLFGGRRAPPWTGYGSTDGEIEDDEIS